VKSLKNQKGVTLLEAIVAIFVITTGLVSALVLIYSSIFGAGQSKNELLASNLAREAAEVIRAKRDSNWLVIESGTGDIDWDDGLYGGMDNKEYRAIINFNDDPEDADFMQWTISYDAYDVATSDETKVYYYDPEGEGYRVYNQYTANPIGTETIFRRLITTKPICYDGSNESIADIGLACSDLVGSWTKIGTQVYVTVRWTDGDKVFSQTYEDRIYNWK